MTHFRELGQIYKNILVRFLVHIKNLKFASDINWPLDAIWKWIQSLASLHNGWKGKQVLKYQSSTLHRGAFCQFIFRWGFGKPLLRILGFTENKKCSPEKVSIIMYLQIDTLHTQKLEFIHLELACSRPGQQKWFFGEC